MLRKLQQVLNYSFVSLFLISFIQSCPVTMIREDWKPMPLVERARNAHVVAVGKAVEVYDDHSITDKPLKVGGFQLFDILKGQQIIEKIYANKSGPIFYILGFGNPAQCLADIEEGETYLLFAIFVPEKFALVAAYETPRGGTATATIENQDQILASLGWRPWSEWSSCSVSCSSGWQSRTRRCRVGNCEGSTTKSRVCNNYPCQGLKNLLKYFKLRRNTRSLIPAPPTHRDAFQINSLGNLSVPTHQIFWNQFPRQFTMFAVAKYVNYTGGYLVSFYDAQDRLQIGIKVSKTSVALEYAQAGKKNQLIAFNVEVIDRKWHQFAFSVGNGVVSFYLDCELIGTQNIAQQTVDGVDRNGNVYLSAKTDPPQETNENIEFYIEELSLSNDAKAGQQQCVFKNLYTEEEEWSGSGTIKPVTSAVLEYKWTKWTSCSKTCGSNGVRRRVRMCTELSWKDSKDECQTLLQKSQEEPCNNNIPCPAHCQQRCVNGVCAAKNKCKCKKNYYGPNCENKRAASCKRECNNGGRCLTSKGICKCPKGFVGKYCEKATCIPACRHGGTCVKPGVCKCRPGYLPPNCKPSCRPSCMNKGLCIRPNRCHCIKEFSGSRCQYAVCKKPCLNGGVCYDKNKCNCKSGWTGDTCNIAICRPKCLNGGQCRLPNRCSCPNKTSGTYCQNVECNPGCHNGGRCLRQNICLCSHKYSGARCQTPVCRPNCVNGGKCVAPNQCVCPSGFFGDSCDRRSCIYKTRVVPQKRTEHIPITTSLPKWCSHHMGWRPCTEKKTEYRTVHITTYRTIYYCD